MKTFNYVVKEEFNVRDRTDRRKKVDRITISYQDNNYYEYRKSFTFPIGTTNMFKKCPLIIC